MAATPALLEVSLPANRKPFRILGLRQPQRCLSFMSANAVSKAKNRPRHPNPHQYATPWVGVALLQGEQHSFNVLTFQKRRLLFRTSLPLQAMPTDRPRWLLGSAQRHRDCKPPWQHKRGTEGQDYPQTEGERCKEAQE